MFKNALPVPRIRPFARPHGGRPERESPFLFPAGKHFPSDHGSGHPLSRCRKHTYGAKRFWRYDWSRFPHPAVPQGPKRESQRMNSTGKHFFGLHAGTDFRFPNGGRRVGEKSVWRYLGSVCSPHQVLRGPEGESCPVNSARKPFLASPGVRGRSCATGRHLHGQKTFGYSHRSVLSLSPIGGEPGGNSQPMNPLGKRFLGSLVSAGYLCWGEAHIEGQKTF